MILKNASNKILHMSGQNTYSQSRKKVHQISWSLKLRKIGK